MNSGNYRQEEKKILDQILDREVYDARMRPNGYNASDGPTIVNVNLYFRSFEKIDDNILHLINSNAYAMRMYGYA